MKLSILNLGSIGQHVRHILEFYICLSNGFEIGVVDYDKRKRSVLLESDPVYALSVLEKMISIFCADQFSNKPIINVIEFNGVVVESQSSFQREEVYLIEHTIHHFAILNIALKSVFTHIEVPLRFGVAYSTSKHNNLDVSIK